MLHVEKLLKRQRRNMEMKLYMVSLMLVLETTQFEDKKQEVISFDVYLLYVPWIQLRVSCA